MRKYLNLYLTLACFLGLIALFVVDGYMGVYDTVYVTAGEREQKIEADFWLQDDHYPWSISVNYGEPVFFRYEVDNRQFSSYSADVEVSVWRSQQKVKDLRSQEIEVDAFGKGQLEWVVDTAELEAAPGEQSSIEYTIMIKRDGLERPIILFLNETFFPKNSIPAR